MTIAEGLDSGLSLKSEYLRDAYYQYDYTKNKLPDKLADLYVTRAQLRALSREVGTTTWISYGDIPGETM